MDRVIAGYDQIPDADLMLTGQGVAYQADMRCTTIYDAAYWDKCAGYEGTAISDDIHRARVEMVRRHWDGPVLDVGIGSGEFIRQHGNAFGYDINPRAVAWLHAENLYSEDFTLGAVTFWDVIEHVPDPADYLDRVPPGAPVFFSVPTFLRLEEIRNSRHYRPGEHLYYFTPPGFIKWLRHYGFTLLEQNEKETAAGRDGITSFAFRRT